MAHPANIQNVLRDVTAPIGEMVDTILRDLTPDLLTLRYPGPNDDLQPVVAKVRRVLMEAVMELNRLDSIFDHADELGRLVVDLQKQVEPATPDTTTEPTEA